MKELPVLTSADLNPVKDAKVDLREWDVILVNTSGGKDSQAMLDLVVELAEQAGVRDRVVLVHADLGRVEWNGVKDLVKEHASHYSLPLEIEKRPQGDLLEHVEKRGMWPSSTARYCTSDHKRGQIRKVMTRLVKAWRARTGETRRCRILNCMGLRAEESPARAKKEPLKPSDATTKTTREVWDWLPILGWKVAQVWDRIAQAETRHHWAYDLGMPRLSCVFCIFAPLSALLVAAKHNPELLDEYVRVEQKIGHRFRKELSLEEVRAKAKTASVETVEDWNM